MRHRFYYLVFSFAVCLTLSTDIHAQLQTQISVKDLAHLNKLQDSLASLSVSTYAIKDDLERAASNSMFVKKLIVALKTPHSFQHNLEAIHHISIQKAPNQTFRIITWSLPFNDGSYKFYGVIQMNTVGGALKILPLNDNTENFTDDNLVTTGKNWYGARYYEMIPVTYPGKPTYYVMLGWKGNNNKTSKKVIEVLSFEKDQPVFGKNIFETPKKESVRNRVVFEYNKKNSMTLQFDRNTNMLIFDHLAPYEAGMEGNFEYYASDLSFDGYTINYQKFYLRENVSLKNEISSTDEFYATPRKATTLFQKSKH